MAKKQINIIVDTMQQSYSTIGTFKQLDSVFFNIQIMEQGLTKDLTGQMLKLFAKKSDGKIVEQKIGITISDSKTGKITIDLLNSILQVAGFVTLELEISDNTGIISTATFTIRVTEKVGSDEAIESTNEISTLKEVELYVIQAKKEIQDFKKLQEQMLITNNNLTEHEATRVSNELLRSENEEIRQEQEIEREVELKSSRNDYWGKEHDSLKERLDSDFKFTHIDGSKGMFLEQKGIGSLTIKNTLEGSVRNLVIKGNTTGGYNPELSTSFPLVSVGQAENGLVTVRTCGKNLCNQEKFITTKTNITITTIISYDWLTGKRGTTVVNYKPNTRYLFRCKSKKISGKGLLYTYVEYTDGTTGGYLAPNGNNITASGKSVKSIYFTYSDNAIYDIDELLLLEYVDDNNPDYEPYKESVVQVQLPSSMGSLKGVGSVQDEVDFTGNIVQKFSEIIFDGEEDFGDGGYTSISGNYINIKYVTDVFDRGAILCDKLPTTAWGDLVEKNYEYITQSTVQQRCILFNILKSKLPTPDVNGFKQWLKTNPLKVIYQLKESIAHEIPTQKLSTFKPITTLSVESEVEANIEGEFPCEIGGVLFDLQEEDKKNKECLEIERKINKENSIKLHAQDIEIISNNLDMDFRILDLEMALSTIGVDHKGISTFAMSPYDMMKTLILNNHYDKADLDHKISVYLKHGRITAQEAQELYDLMEIYPGRS